MDFEEFEKKIEAYGFGIVAMNHYTLQGKRHLFCVILNSLTGTAFRAEGQISSEVFESLYEQILNFKNR